MDGCSCSILNPAAVLRGLRGYEDCEDCRDIRRAPGPKHLQGSFSLQFFFGAAPLLATISVLTGSVAPP